MSDKICTFCGQAGHRAHECTRRPRFSAVLAAKLTADEIAEVFSYGAECAAAGGGRVRAELLRKFDAYVPADQASSMRYRIAELEAQVASLQQSVQHHQSALRLAYDRLQGELAPDLPPVGPRAPVDGAITDPATIEATFAADDAGQRP